MNSAIAAYCSGEMLTERACGRTYSSRVMPTWMQVSDGHSSALAAVEKRKSPHVGVLM